jgi:hypothetical protein
VWGAEEEEEEEEEEAEERVDPRQGEGTVVLY